MAKRKSKGDWPEDWRERIAGDEEDFLSALKEIADPVELGRLWNNTKKMCHNSGTICAICRNSIGRMPVMPNYDMPH